MKRVILFFKLVKDSLPPPYTGNPFMVPEQANPLAISSRSLEYPAEYSKEKTSSSRINSNSAKNSERGKKSSNNYTTMRVFPIPFILSRDRDECLTLTLFLPFHSMNKKY